MSDKKKYKATLNLPKTSFDMRAGLLQKEPAIQKKWADDDLYGQIRQARAGAKRFILHDGPPYANGNIHIGTAMNKVLKDIVVRVKTMNGFDAPYIPGWDCHGLPIEAKVMTNLGEKAKTLDPVVIRRICSEYAEGFVSKQSAQFQSLGVMGLFDDPYITMNHQYEADVIEVFAKLVETGLVYRQLKPVHWSIENRTALADAELEHYDREDTSIYVSLEISDQNTSAIPHTPGDRLCLMIWTTTPWTLPANLAVAVSPQFTYSAIHAETEDGPFTFVVAEKRLSAIIASITENRPGWLISHEVLGSLTGRELIDANLTYIHPLMSDKLCPIVQADYVTAEDGTGMIHTAPGHGIEDYGTALKTGLDIYCPVQADGTYDDTVNDFLVGKSVWDGNNLVIEYLSVSKKLVLAEKIVHSYPHDWRSKTPTIFRATKQWFISVDNPSKANDTSLRSLALDACNRPSDDGGVDFIPAWGKNRIVGMLESRPDWCISRQRAWGLPIPAFYNADGDALLTAASVRAVAETFKRVGSDAWFTLTAAEILDGYDPAQDADLEHPENFNIAGLTAGKDIFDVWFESGSSWSAVALRRQLIDEVPVDLYLEGSDQHRGWFQLSLLPCLGAEQKPPFKSVLTHGFIVDDHGLKMSKSGTNAISVIDQLTKRGADILRLWIASQNYQDDVRCSEKLIAQAEDAYRKIRNTLRFCMGSCSDFDPATNTTPPADNSVDRWMKLQLDMLVIDVQGAFDRYEFHRATRMIYEFCTVQASSIYLSAVKDRLYCQAANSPRRRASQTVIHEMLMTLLKLLAPILPHTCEEAWAKVPNLPADQPQSIHLARLPKYDKEPAGMAETNAIWDQLLSLRTQALVKIESLRSSGVKNSLEAEALFTVATDDNISADLIETYLGELEDLLGVGFARLERSEKMPEDQKITIDIIDTREKYPRCARSWKRRPDVGTVDSYPDLSKRDAEVVDAIANES